MKMSNSMYDLCVKLFPICRSITGDGVRETLWELKKIVPELKLYEVPTGTPAFDWCVPKEWNIRDAFIADSKGRRIVDFQKNNLHVVGYSLPVDRMMSLQELQPYLYTQPDQPDAIPYVTSYYKETFGFCMTEQQKSSLQEDVYHVYIDSELKDGSLTYGELLLPGETEEEIFLSTYVCHPSMANNELSGPAVVIHLAEWLNSMARRRYTYRIIFIPETIGALVYLSRNLDVMKKNIVAGFNVSCVGDNRTFSYIESRPQDTLADRTAQNVLHFVYPDYKRYTFLQRGSDERQYNAPGIDLPVCAICRSKYGKYPEYHTSKDNLSLVSPEGLSGAYEVYQKCILALEHNYAYRATVLGEPQLSKRGLYSTTSQKGTKKTSVRIMCDFLAYADGRRDLIAMSDLLQVPIDDLIPVVAELEKHCLVEKV